MLSPIPFATFIFCLSNSSYQQTLALVPPSSSPLNLATTLPLPSSHARSPTHALHYSAWSSGARKLVVGHSSRRVKLAAISRASTGVPSKHWHFWGSGCLDDGWVYLARHKMVQGDAVPGAVFVALMMTERRCFQRLACSLIVTSGLFICQKLTTVGLIFARFFICFVRMDVWE